PVSMLRCYKIQPDRFLTTDEEQRIHSTMRSYLAPLEERLVASGVTSFVHTRICYSIREEILDFIERNNYDLLFLRVEPASFFSFIRKDFAIEVMKRSECNVIMWKPRRA
ncbi:MAG TPA: universal stress protein, partial [Methanomicrobia archaeon]|nr:universal stress protein [Methanomicrobia archaeon]